MMRGQTGQRQKNLVYVVWTLAEPLVWSWWPLEVQNGKAEILDGCFKDLTKPKDIPRELTYVENPNESNLKNEQADQDMQDQLDRLVKWFWGSKAKILTTELLISLTIPQPQAMKRGGREIFIFT